MMFLVPFLCVEEWRRLNYCDYCILARACVVYSFYGTRDGSEGHVRLRDFWKTIKAGWYLTRRVRLWMVTSLRCCEHFVEQS